MKAFNLVASRWDFNLLAYTDIRVGVQVVGLAVVGLDVVGFLVLGFLVVGFAVGFLVEGVAVGWPKSHHNITSLNAVYAYTMTYNVRSDVKGLSGPTFSLAETEVLDAS
jgi:hypothetical protein